MFKGESVERIWLKSYPENIPPEVDVDEYDSLVDVLCESCSRFEELPAFSNMGESISYAKLNQLSRDFAAYLQKNLNMKRGDRVALMMPNLLQYPVALFGVLRGGFVVVNVNPQYTAPELEHQLLDSGASVIVVLENFAHTLQEVLAKNPDLKISVITTEVGDMLPPFRGLLTNVVVKYVKKMVPEWAIEGSLKFSAVLRTGHECGFSKVSLNHDDVAFLQYTGGTTGVAKGAVLTHGNMVAKASRQNNLTIF
jgi:long-chain acyl-CoA synthetase